MAITVRHERGLAASPGLWHMLEVGRGEESVRAMIAFIV